MHQERYSGNPFYKSGQNHRQNNLMDFKENQEFNKDSVSTSIGETKKEQSKGFKFQANTRVEQNENKKTKFIWKKQTTKAAPIFKHRKVVQTLRNITKNIKNQLYSQKNISINSQHENQPIQFEKIQQDKSPQINHIEPKVIKIEEQSQNLYENKEKISQNSPEKIKQAFSPMKNEKITQKIEQIVLYSKYKGYTQIFPVYQDHKLTNNKELRNLTIHREVDNDIESDEEQIQMSVGYMYYELVSSCYKRSEMKKYQQKVKSGQLARCKKESNERGLDKVKQKLNFY